MTEELKPADLEDLRRRPAFWPRLKGARWLFWLSPVVLFGLWLYLRSEAELEGRKARVRSELAALAPIRARSAALKAQIRQLLETVEVGAPAELRHPQVSLDALRERRGLYLYASRAHLDKLVLDRLKVEDGHYDDSDIVRCLGLGPVHVYELSRRSKLVSPPWAAALEAVRNDIGVRVVEDEFRRLSERDLPRLVEILASDYLLLVLTEAEAPQQADVYIWSLSDNSRIFTSRVHAQPKAMRTVRLRRSPDPDDSEEVSQRVASGAQACALADALRLKLDAEPEAEPEAETEGAADRP